MLSIAYIRDLMSSRRVEEPRQFDWSGETLAAISPDEASFAFVGKKRIEREDWEETIPPDGSQIVFVQMPQGDQWWMTGPAYWLFPDTFAPLYPWLGPELPSISQERGDAARGFGNVQNVTVEGATIPVLYGAGLAGGIVLQRYTSGSANRDEVFNGQYLISHGPIQSLAGLTSDTTDPVQSSALSPGDLYVNGIDATELSDCEIQVRLGSDPNPVMTGAEDVTIQYNETKEITHEDFFTKTTLDAVNAVEVNLSFPEGLYYIAKDDGQPSRATASVSMGVWAFGDDPDVDAAISQVDFKISENRTRPFTAPIKIGNLPTSKYVVRAWYKVIPTHLKIPKRFFGKTVVAALREVQSPVGGGIAYNGKALLHLKIRGTGQLGSGLPIVSVRYEGRKVLNYDTMVTEYTQTAAWCVLDFLQNTVYGLGDSVISGGIDLATFSAWAARCVAVIPKWTGSVDTESRYLFNAILNQAQDAWPLVQQLAAEQGAYIVNFGTSIKAKLDEQQSPVFTINSGNMRADSNGAPVFAASTDNPDTRYDGITVEFRDENDSYNTSSITAPLGIIPTETTRIRKVTLETVTSATQANRYASKLYREERGILENIMFEAGQDSIPLEVGDLLLVAREEPGQWDGRLILDGTPVTLDQEITFEADTIYTYIEQDNATNIIYHTDFEMPAITTNILNFGPLAPGAASFRKYIIGKRGDTSEPVLVRSIMSSEEGFRTFNCVNYAEEVYTDDADSMDPDFYSPPLGALPGPPSNLAVFEAWLADGTSTLTLTFDGGLNATKYAIWYREIISSVNAWSYVGTVLDVGVDPYSYAFNVNTDSGVPVEIAAQSVGANGQEIAIDTATVVYTIARDDDNDNVTTWPDNVTGLTLTPVADNQYTLTWNAVAAKTNYEVRLGNTQGGLLLGSPATESIMLYLNRALQYVDVRAVLNGVYSSGVSKILAGPPFQSGTVPPYTTLEGYIEMEPTAWQDARVGTPVGVGHVRNASRIEWLNNTDVMLQIDKDNDGPLVYFSQGVDLGSQKTVSISPAIRLLSWFDTPLENHAMSERGYSFAGKTGVQYLDWDFYIQYGNTTEFERNFLAGSVSGGVTVTENINSNQTLTGRYFRLYLTCSARVMPDSGIKECRVLLEKLAFHMYS